MNVMQGLEMGCGAIGKQVRNNNSKKETEKNTTKKTSHTSNGVVVTSYDDIYAAYKGDEKHCKYWRSLQSVKPIRCHR